MHAINILAPISYITFIIMFTTLFRHEAATEDLVALQGARLKFVLDFLNTLPLLSKEKFYFLSLQFEKDSYIFIQRSFSRDD